MSPRPATDLSVRLAPFIAAGLMPQLPTPWQVTQGSFAMAPWVISTDVTDETAYRRRLLAHPVVRQPLLLSRIGLDHFAMGSGLRSRLGSVVQHLILTHHSGFPLFDLQLVQTHPDGLTVLRAAIEDVLCDATPSARRTRRLAERLFVDAESYLRCFTDPGGWIDRAAALDYPTAAAEGSAMPPEFFGLVPFLNHCAHAYPRSVAQHGRARAPLQLLRLLGHRFREEGGLGWLPAARRLLCS